MRKRLLLDTEFTALRTGYSTYFRQVGLILSKNPQYEVAELACYCSSRDPRISSVPWKVFPVIPDSEEDLQKYHASSAAQFGELAFEEVCLKFKPHVVLSIRDVWMIQHIDVSPFRPYFYWIYMCPCDSIPQSVAWMSIFSNADALFTYQDWSANALRTQSNNRLNYIYSAPPCANSTFRPIPERESIKSQLGFGGYKIVGTVMRNQRRKLFPRLFKAFRQYLNLTERNDVLLYCHTSYPDAGWNIPHLLLESNLSSKVLFTYKCTNCGESFPTFFNDAMMYCPHCKKDRAHMASVQDGVDDETLCRIYNMMDLYVQYSNCLSGNTNILLKRGWTPISQAQVGDYAWTQKGRWKKVLNVWKDLPKNRDKKIKEVKIHSDYLSVIATEDHKFHSLTKEDLRSTKSTRVTLGDKLRTNQIIPSPTPKPINKLKPGDLLCYTINDEEIDIKQIDLKDYVTSDTIKENTIIGKYGKIYPRFIDVDNDFCKLLGLFIADGSSSRGNYYSIRITSNKMEIENIELAQKVLTKINGKETKTIEYKNRNAINVEIYSKLINNLFCKFGKLENKALPDWCMLLPKEKQKCILQGLFMGDGCHSKDRNVSIYTTTSEKLCGQIRDILRRLRINYNIHLHDRTKDDKRDGKHRRPIYRIEVYGNLKKRDFSRNKNPNSRSIYIENYLFTQIKSIEDIEYKDSVWNVEVEDDHTITLKIGCTNQSEGMGIPMLESAACGTPIFGVDYSSMVDVVPKLEGTLIKVKDLDLEVETGCYRAIPDEEDFIAKLTHFLNLPNEQLLKLREQACKAYHRNYNWDVTAQKWATQIDTLDIIERDKLWKSPPRILAPAQSIPSNLSNSEFARWLIIDVLREPERLGTYMETRLIRDLNYGFTTMVMGGLYFNEMAQMSVKPNFQPFDREKAYAHMVNLCNRRNYWEQRRAQC